MAYVMWTLIAVTGAVAVAAALWLLDRLLLRAEERGWIYYRKKKPSGGTFSSGVGSAMRELDRLVARPSAEHTIEAEPHVVEELPKDDQ